LGPGATITGRVLFEGTPAQSNPAPRLSVQQADAQAPAFGLFGTASPIDAGGDFKVVGASGKVFLTVSPMPPGHMLKSVMVDGVDMTEVPLDLDRRPSVSNVVVTLTDKLTRVSGSVADVRGQPQREYVVLIQSSEPKEPIVASRSVRRARPDTGGRFEVRGLRPGRHIATALEALEPGQESSPDFRQRLRQAPATREFTVGEGQSVTLDLRLTPDL
jgi:hypothetical protein